MSQNTNLNNAIKNNDVVAARAVILGNFRKDRSQKIFKNIEYILFAKKEFDKLGSSFFKNDDGETEFTEDKSKWNVELWENMRIEVDHNFSEKKIDHIFQVMEHLRISGVADFQSVSEGVKTEELRSKVNKPESGNILSQMKFAAILGGAVGGGVGVLVGKPILGSILGVGIGFAIDKKIFSDK